MAEMSKERFRKMAQQGIDAMMRAPDDVWASGYLMMRLRLPGSDEVVVVGLAELTDTDEEVMPCSS